VTQAVKKHWKTLRLKHDKANRSGAHGSVPVPAGDECVGGATPRQRFVRDLPSSQFDVVSLIVPLLDEGLIDLCASQAQA
jgi:hypothetical protein